MTDVDAFLFDEKNYFAPIATSLPHRVAYRLLGRRPPYLLAFERDFVATAERLCPDVVLIVKGAFVRPTVLRRLRATGARLVNYSTDDPFNPATSTKYLRQAIPEYDLYVTPRRANVSELRAAGARHTAIVPFGYNPAVHFVDDAHGDTPRFACDLLFVGGGDSDRIPFFRRVVELWPDVHLKLFGGYWGADRVLARYACGFARGQEFRQAIRAAKFVVNLVRRQNRDGHVMRTFEVPACGGCMLAERTDDHEQFFEDGIDALFFSSPEELVSRARALLGDDHGRRTMAAAGHTRIVRGQHTYKDRLLAILSHASTIAVTA